MKPIIIAAAMAAVLLGSAASPALAQRSEAATVDCDWRMTPCARTFGETG